MGAQAAPSGAFFVLPWAEAERRLYPPFHVIPCDWTFPYQRVRFSLLALAFGSLKPKSDVFRLHQIATLQILQKHNWKHLFSLNATLC